jgi:hypothetical protein
VPIVALFCEAWGVSEADASVDADRDDIDETRFWAAQPGIAGDVAEATASAERGDGMSVEEMHTE